MKLHQLFLAPALLFLLVVSCTNQDLETLADDAIRCDTLPVKYAPDTLGTANVLAIVEANCSNPDFGSCHQAGEARGDYTTFQGLKDKVTFGVFQTRVLINQEMPPSYSNGPTALSKCDLQILQKWVDEGAQNN